MKAILHTTYGPPERLLAADIERPMPAADGVLVRVHAASVNAYDWHMIRGKPYITRPGEGLRRPKDQATGVDASGTVEAVGSGVDHVRVGDRVFGARNGAFAEYVSGRTFVRMPAGLTFEEAAAVPTAGCTALQAIRNKAKLQAGQRVLITGAGGGVGTFAVQIGKAFGAHVTAETGSSKADLVASLGADQVIERGRDDLVAAGPFDAIVDVGGGRPLGYLGRALGPGGTLVIVGPGQGNWLGPIAHLASGVIRSRMGSRRFRPFLASVTRDDLVVLRELIEAGKVRSVIDSAYSIDDVAKAVRRVEEGSACGKVVIRVVDDSAHGAGRRVP